MNSLFKKRTTPGEIFKESFIDVFHTDLEQISFSLYRNDATILHNDVTALRTTPNPRYLTSLGDRQSLITESTHNASETKTASQHSVSRALNQGDQPELIQDFVDAEAHKKENVLGRSTVLDLTVGDYTSSGNRIGSELKPFISNPTHHNLTFTGTGDEIASRQLETGLYHVTPEHTKHAAEDQSVSIGRNEPLNLQQETLASELCDQADSTRSTGPTNDKQMRTKMPIVVQASGKIIKINKTQVTLQKTQPVLFYSGAALHVRSSNWVKRGTPLLTVTHQTLMTGDIVQGIPKIEQLFEALAPPSPTLEVNHYMHNTLQTQVRGIFRANWLKSALPVAVRKSLQEIQQILVESLQKAYLAQGVLIADKHMEIVVKQITSKGQILDGGSTGLLLGEILHIRQIEKVNVTCGGKKALYAPAVIGLTQAALHSDSFISSASFQETTRVLSRDAMIGKHDFLRGLKEKVVIGDLISAGTALQTYFPYMLIAQNKIKKIS